MFSYKMEGLPGLLLRLMLTGLLVSANTFSPSTHGIPFFKKPSKPGRLEEEMKVQGESLSIKGFCSQQTKVWCKGDLLKECNPTESPSLSGPGWKYLTTKPNQRVVLQDLKNGCFSFFMSALQVEDSGIYLFGVTDGLNIAPLRKINVIVQKGLLAPTNTFSPPTSKVAFLKSPSKPGKRLEVVMKVQGESLSIEGFCSPQYLQQEGVWCKGDLLKECNPTEPSSLSGLGWKYLTSEPSQKFVLQDLGNGCAAFFTSALQVEDSGVYWFGVPDGLNITPLRKIKVIVQKGQQNYGTATETSENEQRLYHIVLVLVSIAVGITIIAALILVVTMLIKKKTRAADDLNFGDNPNCRIITFQIHESTATDNPLDKETNAVYAILKKPKSMTEDVTYVNTKFPLRSSFIKHPSELSSPGECSPGVISSGSVKYANIIFGSQVPHIKD